MFLSACVLAITLGVLPGCQRGPGAGGGGGGSGGGSGGGGGASASAAAPVDVTLVPVELRPVDRVIEITGTLFGQEEATIAAQVPGRVIEVLADLGDELSPGELLARIDPTDDQIAVDQRRAELQTALARLGLDAMPDDGAAVDIDALPVVARARAQADNAAARLARARLLFERTPPLISEQEFADIRAQAEVASTGVGVERLAARSLVADVRVRAAALRQAERRLGQTRVSAPVEAAVTYRVAQRNVSVGEVVADGRAMFRLVASDRVKFRGQVPERFAREVIAGAEARLRVTGFDEPFAAKVTRVSPAVDVQTRSFEVEIEAANPGGVLKPGGFALAQVRTAEAMAGRAQGRFVPESAVLSFAGVQRVLSVQGGKVIEHRVKLGPTVQGRREVLEGLPEVPGVIDRPRGLSPGAAVRVTDAPRAG